LVGKKAEEMHIVNDRNNEMQLKMFTVNEELERNKASYNTEISYHNKCLEKANKKNKLYLKDFFEKEEEFKTSKQILED